MEWFRLYDDIINDPKILRLDETLRWRYIALLCIVSKNTDRGYLPDDEDICLMMRINKDDWADTKLKLIERGLINQSEDNFIINGWFKRQYLSDNAAERVRKHRELKRNSNVTVTPPDTEQNRTDTEQIQNRAEHKGALDPEAELFAKAIAITKENLSLTQERRQVLRDIRGNVNAGSDKFLRAVKNMMKSNWPNKTVTYFTDKKFDAINRIDHFANSPPRGNGFDSPPVPAPLKQVKTEIVNKVKYDTPAQHGK